MKSSFDESLCGSKEPPSATAQNLAINERERGEALAREISEFIEVHGRLLTRYERFMLGLGRAKLLMQEGERRDRNDIARDAGVSRQAIEHIEHRALRKCRSTSLRILAREHLEWRPAA